MIWPLLALAALALAHTADNKVGEAALTVLACFLLTCGLMVAPWSDVFSA